MTSNLRTHDLKCWPPFFASLLDGSKTFEIRWDDRNFRVGDTLHIREYNPETQTYTGAEVHRRVTYIFNSGNRFGLQPGWAVLGLAHETSVTPEFAAGFERGTVAAVVKEVAEIAKDRTDAYWSGHAGACEEITHRLEEAWAALPVSKECQHRENNAIADTHAKWCVECGAFHDGSQWIHPWRSAAETPAERSPLEASDAFVAKFGREPMTASDSAWMNGFAAGKRSVVKSTVAQGIEKQEPLT